MKHVKTIKTTVTHYAFDESYTESEVQDLVQAEDKEITSFHSVSTGEEMSSIEFFRDEKEFHRIFNKVDPNHTGWKEYELDQFINSKTR